MQKKELIEFEISWDTAMKIVVAGVLISAFNVLFLKVAVLKIIASLM